jgi:glycosyltransferase involved in cell wall biosynthesis
MPSRVQNHRISVMHMLRDLGVGGAQQVVRTLAEHLNKDGCVPIVCALEDGALCHDIEELGIEVVFLRGRRYRTAYLPLAIHDLLRIRRDLVNLIEEYEIKLVQTHHMYPIDLLLLTLLPTTQLQAVVWTFHSANFMSTRTKLAKRTMELIYRLSSRKASKLVAVSDQVHRAVVQRIRPAPDKIVTIYNGVDLERYVHPVDRLAVRRQLGFGADEQIAITVGTLRKPKGHAFLIDAAVILVPQHPDLHFLFAGDGQLGAELQAKAKSLGLSSNVHFLGNRSDVPALLAASDLFVLPSLWEGLSMALLEAMAAGKPVVATAVSGTKLVMIPNETGLIVPPGDAAGLAEAILSMISNPERAMAMGAASSTGIQRAKASC